MSDPVRHLVGTAVSEASWSDINVFVDDSARVYVEGMVSSHSTARGNMIYDPEQATRLGEILTQAGVASAKIQLARREYDGAKNAYENLFQTRVEQLAKASN